MAPTTAPMNGAILMLPTPTDEKLYGGAANRIGCVVAKMATQHIMREYSMPTKATAGMRKKRRNGVHICRQYVLKLIPSVGSNAVILSKYLFRGGIGSSTGLGGIVSRGSGIAFSLSNLEVVGCFSSDPSAAGGS